MFLKLKRNAIETIMFLSVCKGYRFRHKTVCQNVEDLRRLSLEEKQDYYNFWKKINKKISFKTVEISKTLSGEYNRYIVPEEFYALYFEPYFNKDKSVGFLQNKSIYNKWFEQKYFPKDFFHKINGIYYTHDFKLIDDIGFFIDTEIDTIDLPIVIKPNKDSYGGADIYFIDNKDDIKDIIRYHADLVVQEKIKQSELINVFNEDSINTVQVCLYRDEKGLMHVLNCSIRMGKDGSLDNETAGGIVCNIKSSGLLNKYAVDKYASKYFKHPNSGYIFENKKLPLYDDLKKVSIEVAQNIIGANLISLDMALDSNNSWRCIEVNLFGQTIRFAQYAGEPFFGVFTDEIKRLIIESQIEK